MSAQEQCILTLSEKGYGKRTLSYEYRITGRGGKGIVAMAVNKRNGQLVASFPVADDDQIMLISNGGQTIRLPSVLLGVVTLFYLPDKPADASWLTPRDAIKAGDWAHITTLAKAASDSMAPVRMMRLRRMTDIYSPRCLERRAN